MKITPIIFSYFNNQGTAAERKQGPFGEFLPQNGVTSPFKNFTPFFRNTLLEDTFSKNIAASPGFKGHKCGRDDFRLKEIYGVPCPCCGRKMLLDTQMNAGTRKISKNAGANLVEELTFYDKMYRPVEREAARIIKRSALEHPNADISTLVSIENKRLKGKLEDEQIKILLKLKGIAMYCTNPEQREEFKEFINQNMALIKSKDPDDYFKRKIFIEEFYKQTENLEVMKHRRDDFEELRSKVETLPSSKSNVYAFFAKYSRRSSEEIAQRLLKPAVATTEHIVPHSKGGEDNTSNYLLECDYCNSNRGNEEFDEWVQSQPDMERNLQKYLDYITPKIAAENLPEYSDYPEDIIETIGAATGGRIVLHKPEPKPKEKPAKRPEHQKPLREIPVEEQYQKLAQDIEDKRDRITELDREREELMSTEEFGEFLKYKNLTAELTTCQSRARRLSRVHNNAWKSARTKARKLAKKNGENPESAEISREDKKRIDGIKKALIKAQAEEKEAQRRLSAHLETFQEPSALQAELKELSGIISTAEGYCTEIRKNAATESVKKSAEVQLEKKIAERDKLKEELKTLQAETDFTGPENRTLYNRMQTVHKKLAIIEQEYQENRKPNFKPSSQISATFILDEAKKSLTAEKEELLQNNAAMCAELEFKIQEADGSIEYWRDYIAELQKRIDETNRLQGKLDALLEGKTLEELIERKEELQAKAARYRQYENLQNYSTRISVAESYIEEDEREFMNLNRTVSNAQNPFSPEAEPEEATALRKSIQEDKDTLQKLKGQRESKAENCEEIEEEELKTLNARLEELRENTPRKRYSRLLQEKESELSQLDKDLKAAHKDLIEHPGYEEVKKEYVRIQRKIEKAKNGLRNIKSKKSKIMASYESETDSQEMNRIICRLKKHENFKAVQALDTKITNLEAQIAQKERELEEILRNS